MLPPLGLTAPADFFSPPPKPKKPDFFFESFSSFVPSLGLDGAACFVFPSFGLEDYDQNTFTGLIAASPSKPYSPGGKPFIVFASMSFFVVI